MMDNAPRRVRRFVTGHDAHGGAVFLSQDAPPQYHTVPSAAVENVDLIELWSTTALPVMIAAAEPTEPNDRALQIEPPANGTVFRIVDLYPGHSGKLPPRTDGRPPGSHRTETLDYGIVIEGEVHLTLDDDTVVMLPGDVVIQRGTVHAWENRTSSRARIAFVLIDAHYAPDLKTQLSRDEETHSATLLSPNALHTQQAPTPTA